MGHRFWLCPTSPLALSSFLPPSTLVVDVVAFFLLLVAVFFAAGSLFVAVVVFATVDDILHLTRSVLRGRHGVATMPGESLHPPRRVRCADVVPVEGGSCGCRRWETGSGKGVSARMVSERR